MTKTGMSIRAAAARAMLIIRHFSLAMPASTVSTLDAHLRRNIGADPRGHSGVALEASTSKPVSPNLGFGAYRTWSTAATCAYRRGDR
jgi:hypothetical protein